MQKCAAGKFHHVSSKKIEGRVGAPQLIKFKLRIARLPLALTLPLKSLGGVGTPHWQLGY
jgi:hypothetical protein